MRTRFGIGGTRRCRRTRCQRLCPAARSQGAGEGDEGSIGGMSRRFFHNLCRGAGFPPRGAPSRQALPASPRSVPSLRSLPGVPSRAFAHAAAVLWQLRAPAASPSAWRGRLGSEDACASLRGGTVPSGRNRAFGRAAWSCEVGKRARSASVPGGAVVPDGAGADRAREARARVDRLAEKADEAGRRCRWLGSVLW